MAKLRSELYAPRMDARIAEMPSSQTRQLIIVVNGPGEVHGWLSPLAAALKRELPHVRICVALAPCVFSSGAELSVVSALPSIDACCDTSATMAMIFRGRMPAGFSRDLPGAILHLGGETYLTLLLSKRLGRPCLAYVEAPFPIRRAFERVLYSGFVPIPPRKMTANAVVIGEMMLDALKSHRDRRAGAVRDRMTIGLFPGSRDYLVKYTMPFLAVMADRVAAAEPDIEWVVAQSKFLTAGYLRSLPDVNDGRPIEGQNLIVEENDGAITLVTQGGLRIAVSPPEEVWSRLGLAVTIPGTSTADLAILGIPFILMLPTAWGDTAPLPGLAGHLRRVPLIGRYLKRALAHLILRQFRFLAHPNRRADRMIAPEIVGRFAAGDLANAVLDLIRSDRATMSLALQEAMGEPGATDRVVAELRPYLIERPRDEREASHPHLQGKG